MHAIADKKSAVPNGRETANTGRLKIKAAMRKIIVVACSIPVDFRRVSNIATSRLSGSLRSGNQIV